MVGDNHDIDGAKNAKWLCIIVGVWLRRSCWYGLPMIHGAKRKIDGVSHAIDGAYL